MPISFQKHLPNVLSLLRLALLPFIIGALVVDSYWTAFVLALIAALTDFADGYLARLWKVESSFGQIIDPMSDKAYMVFISFILLFKGPLKMIEIAVFLGITAKELITIGGINYLKKIGVPIDMRPHFIGKVTTACLFVYIGCQLLFLATTMPLWVMNILGLLVLILMILTIIVYFQKGRSALKDKSC